MILWHFTRCGEFSKGLISTSEKLQSTKLRRSVVRAVHRHRTGVGSIPAGGPYS